MTSHLNQALELLFRFASVDDPITAEPLALDGRKTFLLCKGLPRATINAFCLSSRACELRKLIAHAIRQNLPFGIQRVGLMLAKQDNIMGDSFPINWHCHLPSDRGILA